MIFVCHLTALILAGFSLAYGSPIDLSCEDVNCNSSFHDTIVDDSFNILDEDTLSLHCNDILEDIACKRDHLSRCNKEAYKSFSMLTDGIVDVLSELCNDTSKLRRVYHKHSRCIANSTDAYQDCVLNTATSVAEHVSNPNEDFYEDDVVPNNDIMVQRFCLFYHPFKDCVTQETSKSCGHSAARFVEDMIIRMSNAAVREKCSNRTD